MSGPKYTLGRQDIDLMSPASGRVIKDDNSQVNVTDALELSARGNLAWKFYLQDQVTQPVDVFFTEKKGTATTTTVATQGGHTVFVQTGLSIIAGDVIESRTAENFVQAQITAYNSVTGQLDVDTPWSRTFPIGVTVGVGNPNLHLANGSLGSPVVFSLEPSSVQEVDITRLILTIIDSTAADFETFGGIAGGIANGCVLRYKQADGTYINLFNWKTNGELIERSFDHTFQSKFGGGGPFGFVARSTWAGQDKRGVAIRLDGSLGEAFEIVVQDDLRGLDRYRIIGQGHIVQP